MRAGKAALLLGLCVLPLPGAEKHDPIGPRQSFEVTSTERFSFSPGGTLRMENSYGYLTVEGWDEPEVEVTVTKTTDRFEDPKWKEKAAKLFDQIRVGIDRRSDTELTVMTTLPRRTGIVNKVLSPVLSINKRGVTVEYKIRAPRNSRLIVHHNSGYVWVSDLTGDVDVNSHTGDMIVALPDPGPHAIDAKTAMGRISSDIPCETGNPLLAGARVVCAAPASAARIHLRMGRGSIEIKNGPALGPYFK